MGEFITLNFTSETIANELRGKTSNVSQFGSL